MTVAGEPTRSSIRENVLRFSTASRERPASSRNASDAEAEGATAVAARGRDMRRSPGDIAEKIPIRKL